MKASIVAITLAALVAACGGSPTQPSPSQAPNSSTVPVTGQPPSPSDPPSPAPTPAPAPAPTPTPAPAPQPDLRLDATTDGASWSDDSKALPSAFAVVVWPDRLQVADRTLTRDTKTPEHIGIIASDASGTFTLQRGQLSKQWMWTFSGPAGHATGSAYER